MKSLLTLVGLKHHIHTEHVDIEYLALKAQLKADIAYAYENFYRKLSQLAQERAQPPFMPEPETPPNRTLDDEIPF